MNSFAFAPRKYPAPTEAGGSGKEQQGRKQFSTFQPMPGMSAEPLQFVYMRGGKEERETREVPRALLHALTDPGESGLAPMQAMHELAAFYNSEVTPELDAVILKGMGSVPAAILSSMIQSSYRKHAVCAATDKEASTGLFLDDPEVNRYLRTVAALATGKSMEEVQKVAPEKVFVWVGKTVTTIERTVSINMKTERLVCDRGSHKEELEVSVPDGTTVQDEQKKREQKFASLPQMKDTLDMAFGQIEQLRGQPLDSAERNTVVAHLNVTYIEDPKDRLPVIL